MADETTRSPMTDSELLALIAREERAALGSEVAGGTTVGGGYRSAGQRMTTLEVDRFNALNMYFARPLGNEVENSSTVVLPELRDTVEWIMPQLMRIFVAARTPCIFEPSGETDIEQARLETELVRSVFMDQNPGFFVIHDFCKDALLLRNGYMRVRWVEEEQSTVENFSSLTQDELALLLSDKADERVEVLEQRERQEDIALPGMPSQPLPVFDVRLRRTAKRGRVAIECVAPEDILVSNRTRTELEETPFIAHKTQWTRSDLIAKGFKRDVVDKLAPGRPAWLNIDALARDVVVDELSIEDPAQKAMQEIEVRDVTMRVDFDGDGVAELRQILVAGDQILANEEIEEVPFVSAVPKRMPHRHVGLSLYDELADIQLIKSQLAREGLNNLRLANAGRWAVDGQNCNLEDLLDTRAGGVVRTRGAPQNVVMPMQHPSNLMEQVVPMMQYVDTWREFRTGVGKDSVGLDPDALQNVTASAHLAGMAAASLKIELIARCLAEGLKDAFVKVRALLMRHQREEMQIRVGGKFLTVDPRTFAERSSISANVGLGSGNRPEARQNLMMLANAQKELAAFGLVGPEQAYHAFELFCSILGFEQPERFAMNPGSPEYQQFRAQHPPQPNPAVMAAQTRLQAAKLQAQSGIAKAQAEQQAAAARAQAEITHAALQNREDRMVDLANIDSQTFIALVKALAPIVAAQLKGDPAANAGGVVREDVQGLEGRA